MTKSRIMDDYVRIKKAAEAYVNDGKWEFALRLIFFAGKFMYKMNQIQYDAQIEDMLQRIAEANLHRKYEKKDSEKAVLFYDGFGNINRGLGKIYLKALKELNIKTFYVTDAKHRKALGPVREIVPCENIFFVSGKSFLEQMKNLGIILEDIRPENALIYTTPDDVVGIGAFSMFKGEINRFLINLTDHAFWMGRISCDVIINFREFGWKMCELTRNCPQNDLAYLPYYPYEESVEFKGLPFSGNGRKLIFSGGSLYKTESRDNQYYNLVDKILRLNPDIDFAYFGNGDPSKMKKLVKKYPRRVYWAKERADFYEVMKRCTLYLSTYPYNGGLMTQYALLAGKIPVTLCCKGIDKELSLSHENSFWDFHSFEECFAEIVRLLQDNFYREKKEQKTSEFLLTPQQFRKELQHILENGRSLRGCIRENIEYEGFSRFPIENYTGLKYYRLFFRKNCSFIFRLFPKEYLLGAIGFILSKVSKWI